jgi:hypothetical protein
MTVVTASAVSWKPVTNSNPKVTSGARWAASGVVPPTLTRYRPGGMR